MKGKVRFTGDKYIGQKLGVLVAQSVPPLLPAYNKFMGGVDKTDQLHKYYAFDHRCKQPWMRASTKRYKGSASISIGTSSLVVVVGRVQLS